MNSCRHSYSIYFFAYITSFLHEMLHQNCKLFFGECLFLRYLICGRILQQKSSQFYQFFVFFCWPVRSAVSYKNISLHITVWKFLDIFYHLDFTWNQFLWIRNFRKLSFLNIFKETLHFKFNEFLHCFRVKINQKQNSETIKMADFDTPILT